MRRSVPRSDDCHRYTEPHPPRGALPHVRPRGSHRSARDRPGRCSSGCEPRSPRARAGRRRRRARRGPAEGRGLPEPLLRAPHEEAGRTRRLAVPHRARRPNCPRTRTSPTSRPSARPAAHVGRRAPRAQGFGRRGRSSACSANRNRCARPSRPTRPGPDDDVYPVIEIAWQNGVLPKKGFDLVLDRHGVCSAITMVSSSDLTGNADLRDYCVGRLVRALHAQLDRAAPQRPRGPRHERPADATIPQIVEDAPGAVRRRRVPHRHVAPVQRGADEHVPAAGPENDLARELCDVRPQAVDGPAGQQRRRRSTRATTTTSRS